ncbi:DAK2 domain-containing protein [Corynebacterium qintianiae]|uniref:DAK2 domain-containing protein n=1 Tax=Corynebacterium qintianiae TaxID=2709392 RepID=A0A7T0PER3_9CORY|nr:DAK2 domain-containing protein [Corynebacterium qintianiae]QPK84103.1 DAK2 domain-containing protein [Corynebacterium qintianiae]
MVNPPLFDGARLLSWAQRSAAELERRRVEINRLNVFPVPDSDTGSNMAHTMAAAVSEAAKLEPGASARDVAEALAVGSMRGARGNSGVVLSQVIRGVAQSAGDGALSGHVVAQALSAGVQFVDRAIADPVEGTVVTVLRAAAEAATAAQDGTLEDVVLAARDAARDALADTPSQLAALREAGVVDAGGTGLVILLEQLANEVTGVEGEDYVPLVDAPGGKAHLEIMFIFRGPLDALERKLLELGGDSLVIARAGGAEGDEESMGKVHVHSYNAGELIEAAFALGSVSELRLEILPTDVGAGSPERLIVAVTPPGSLTELYSTAGAVTVAPGGNPDVTGERLLEVIRESHASEVILLPNGLMGNTSLVDVEKAARALEQTLTVLPTVRLVSGIAALAVYDATQPLATVAFTMSEAAGEMRTAVIQRVKGQVTVTAYGETSSFQGEPHDAVATACARLLEHGGELVSVLFDPLEIPELDSDTLTEKLGAEVHVYPADGLGAVAEIGVE